MKQEHVIFLHPTFLSSTFKTVYSVLPITNNFLATDPVAAPQVKQQELQTTGTPQQSDKGRTTAVPPSVIPWFLYSLSNGKLKGSGI